MFNKLSSLVFILFCLPLTGEIISLDDLINGKSHENEVSLPIGPMVKNGCDLFLTADFLYFGVNQTGLSFARSGIATTSGANATQGTTKNISTAWDPGFRVGVGAILPHDSWQVSFEYTWLHSKKSNQAGDGFFPLWNVGGFMRSNNQDFAATQSQASFKQTFNNLDITLGKYLKTSEKLMIMPFMGIRGTYYDQDYDVRYDGVLAHGLLLQDSNLLMKIDQYYWGIGLVGGMNTDWKISSHFSIFGNLLIAGLSSHFNSQRKDYITSLETNTTSRVVNTSAKFYTVVPAFDLQLGLKCDYHFKQMRYHLGAEIGYEAMVYLDQNHYISLINSASNSGNLSFNGLKVRLRFDF